ncbi:hypothetical protein TNCT_285071 [Trichonephila clavata]|uniref:Uncharacterized protein n=1 Tax=Trichonephila clavata TaxID=2740835 RepID=A0A8X6F349_TRICU|nr:hypothetical protein TNCT_285071 [Trichonephila clavata]
MHPRGASIPQGRKPSLHVIKASLSTSQQHLPQPHSLKNTPYCFTAPNYISLTPEESLELFWETSTTPHLILNAHTAHLFTILHHGDWYIPVRPSPKQYRNPRRATYYRPH